MPTLEHALDTLAAETGFSGVVRVDGPGGIELEKAYGMADRRHGIRSAADTQFAIASGGKGLTALAVVSLIEAGRLDLATTARSVLGADLPLIGADVTVEHLLSHRSGIGDYLDEEAGGAITDYVMPVPVHELATTEQYLAVLGGHPAAFPAGERFAYCNGGYVVLALIAERTSGVPFHELVRERVCAPAGMGDTAFLRSDDLPGRAAVGYLSERRRDDERPAPAGAGKRRRRDLLDRGGHPRPLERVLRGPDRLARLGRRDGAPAQRRPRGGQALRARALAARVGCGRDARGLRRRRLVPQQPRPSRRHDPHGDLQHERGGVAGGEAPRRLSRCQAPLVPAPDVRPL